MDSYVKNHLANINLSWQAQWAHITENAHFFTSTEMQKLCNVYNILLLYQCYCTDLLRTLSLSIDLEIRQR